MYNRYIMQRGGGDRTKAVVQSVETKSAPQICSSIPEKKAPAVQGKKFDNDELLILLLILILIADGDEESGMLVAALIMILLV